MKIRSVVVVVVVSCQNVSPFQKKIKKMIDVFLHISPNCPFSVQMKAHPVLKVFENLPEKMRLAKHSDFFNHEGALLINKAYLWHYVKATEFNASRIKSIDNYDEDLIQAIQGGRVWVLDN